jgi:hypothetical protein
MSNEEFPSYCILANGQLDGMDKKLDKIGKQVESLVSMDGPISRIQQRLAIVEGAADRAHTRIDSANSSIEVVKKSHNALAVKVAGFVAALVTLANFLVGKVQ